MKCQEYHCYSRQPRPAPSRTASASAAYRQPTARTASAARRNAARASRTTNAARGRRAASSAAPCRVSSLVDDGAAGARTPPATRATTNRSSSLASCRRRAAKHGRLPPSTALPGPAPAQGDRAQTFRAGPKKHSETHVAVAADRAHYVGLIACVGSVSRGQDPTAPRLGNHTKAARATPWP